MKIKTQSKNYFSLFTKTLKPFKPKVLRPVRKKNLPSRNLIFKIFELEIFSTLFSLQGFIVFLMNLGLALETRI